MSTIKDYSIIETQWIDNYIQILSDKIKSAAEQPLTGDIYSIDSWTKQLEVLIKVKSKLKPLTPIIENAFRQGERFARHGIREIETGEKNLTLDLPEYINNTIIE